MAAKRAGEGRKRTLEWAGSWSVHFERVSDVYNVSMTQLFKYMYAA